MLVLFWLTFVKLILGEDIGTRPLLFFGILLSVMSVQFLTTGILSEMMTRTYYASSDHKSYVIRNIEQLESDTENAWRKPESV